MNTMPPFLKGDFIVNSVNVGSPNLLRATLCTRPQGKEFVLFDTVYTSIAQLEAISVDDTDMECAEFRDSFGRPVLRVIEDVPCFDEGDYAYDQFRFVYFIVGSTLAAVNFSKGSRGISDLQVFSEIAAVSPLYEGKLRALGYTKQQYQRQYENVVIWYGQLNLQRQPSGRMPEHKLVHVPGRREGKAGKMAK